VNIASDLDAFMGDTKENSKILCNFCSEISLGVVYYIRCNVSKMLFSTENTKYKRYNIPRHAHGLTFSCYENRPFLESQTACRLLSDSITKASIKHSFDIWAYVFMPNHVHLLIYPRKDEYSISKILHSIKRPMARRMISILKKSNSLNLIYLKTGLSHPEYRFWQDGGGLDKNYWSTGEYLTFVNYIHENPVRKGLVCNADDWYWSSAGYWMSEVEGPIKIHKSGL
jgi:putative transposase